MRTISKKTVDWERAFYVPLTILAWLAVVVISAWLLGHVAKTILTLVLSGIVAFALTPLVSRFERILPRGVAIAIAYVLGFALILGLGALLIITAANQVTNLVGNIPHYSKGIQHLEPQIVRAFGPFGVTRAKFHTGQQQAISYLQGSLRTTASQSLNIVSTVLGTIIDIVLVLILSVYLTSNGRRIAGWLREETPTPQRRYTAVFIAILNQVVGGYIRGTLTLATLIGFLVGIGMLLLHVPYAVLLGVLAFFMEFIPVVGVLISGAVCIFIALFEGWITAVLVLVYFVVVHVIEGDVVGPRIMGKAVGIHPATALIALVAGTELFGIWGALFGAPLAGLLQAIATVAYRELRGGEPAAIVQTVIDEEQARNDEEPGTEPGARPLLS